MIPFALQQPTSNEDPASDDHVYGCTLCGDSSHSSTDCPMNPSSQRASKKFKQTVQFAPTPSNQ
jgi:hypothetical protein